MKLLRVFVSNYPVLLLHTLRAANAFVFVTFGHVQIFLDIGSRNVRDGIKTDLVPSLSL